MMEQAAGPTPLANRSDDTSYDLSRLIRISAHATLVSSLFAMIGALGLALALYDLYNTVVDWGRYNQLTDLVLMALLVSFLLLLSFSSSVVMRAISEALLVLRDVEENTRQPSESTAGPRFIHKGG